MSKIKRTLAIETSCDDTSVAVVSFDGTVFSVEKMLSYTQLALHKQYGGVVPELAARSHLEKIIPLVQAVEAEIGYSLEETVDTISVTAYPGLPGALVVGVTAAHMLGALWEKPVVEVHHIMGHVFSILIDRPLETMQLPYLCLTVSGGHNDIYLVEEHPAVTENVVDDDIWHKRKHIPLDGSVSVGPYKVTKCAQTMDDAAGEVFDKVARMFGGPYPGGKWVDEHAAAHREHHGDTIVYPLTKPKMAANQFSLSGLKSQLYNLTHKLSKQGKESIDEATIQAVCHSFSETMTKTLTEKFIHFVEDYQPKTAGLVGGVSANRRLRESIAVSVGNRSFYVPEKLEYCTDNAAMIGVVGLLMEME